MRPRAILVTGVPGSGKSTLGRELAQSLRIPFLARDDVRGGLLFSAGAWGESIECIPSGAEAVELFLDIVEVMLNRDLSCVVEYVVRSHRREDLDRILAAGDCVVIRTECDDAMARFEQRNMGDRLISNGAVLDALCYDSVGDHTAGAVERMRQVEHEMLEQFPVPLLRVDTTDGYDPPLDAVIEFATQTAPTQPGRG